MGLSVDALACRPHKGTPELTHTGRYVDGDEIAWIMLAYQARDQVKQMEIRFASIEDYLVKASDRRRIDGTVVVTFTTKPVNDGWVGGANSVGDSFVIVMDGGSKAIKKIIRQK